MARYKGGRGKKAPYETQLVRVPVPLLDTVKGIIAEYRGNLPSDKTDIPVTTSSITPHKKRPKAPKTKKIPVTSSVNRWVPEPEGPFTPLWDLGISGVVRLREHFASIEQLLPLNADDLAALNIKNPRRVLAAVELWKKRRKRR